MSENCREERFMNKPVVLLVTTATSSSRTAEENLGLGYIAAACREKDINAIIIDGWLEAVSYTHLRAHETF